MSNKLSNEIIEDLTWDLSRLGWDDAEKVDEIKDEYISRSYDVKNEAERDALQQGILFLISEWYAGT